MKATLSPIPILILFVTVTAFVGFSYIIFTQFLEVPQNPSNSKTGLEINDVNGGNIVYVKNTGTRNIITDQIKASIDGSSLPCIFDVSVISPGKTEVCELPRKCNFGALLKVSADLESDTVTCPPSSGPAPTSTVITSTPSTTLVATTTQPQITTSTTQQITPATVLGITTPINMREVQQCIGNGNVEVNFQWDYNGQADYFELAVQSISGNFQGYARESGFIYEFPSEAEIEWELTVLYQAEAESKIKTFQTISC